jgi:hypothetical protein
MIELDLGHLYLADHYPAKESDYNEAAGYNRSRIQFRKRIGKDYPGNEGSFKDGTSTQELLRIIIKRALYVDGQEQHKANKSLVDRCRQSLEELEKRAALRRGSDYYKNWIRNPFKFPIEDIPVCKICGHIFCTKHGGENG